jgi:hypothetical protein
MQLIKKQLHIELRNIPCWITGKDEEYYFFLPTEWQAPRG